MTIKLTRLNDFPIEELPTGKSLVCYVTDSPLSVTNIEEMAMFYIKLTSLDDFPLEDGQISPIGQFKQSLDSFYVTDSALSVTNIAEMAMFYKN